MGLKCRLLGHDYGEPEVERSREEQGDEVVVTVREVQVCGRCGTEDLVSQNREVTAIRSPSEVGLDADPSDSVADDRMPNEPSAPAGSEPPGSSAGPDGASSPAEANSPARGADSTVEPADLDEVTADPAESPAVERAPDPSAQRRTPDIDDPAADENDGAAEIIDRVDDASDADPASASEAGEGADASRPDPDRPSGQSDSAGGVPSDTADGEAGGDGESDTDGWETGSDEWDDVDPGPDADDAVILDAGKAERDETQWPEETDTGAVGDTGAAADAPEAPEAPEAHDAVDTHNGADAPDADPDEQVTNDAEIIDGGAEAVADDAGERATDRDPGAWPERDDLPGTDGDPGGESESVSSGVDAADGNGWPAVEGDDEGYDAAPGGDADLELGGGGLTPEVNGHADDGTDTVEGVAAEEAPGIGRSDRNESHGEGFIRTPESGTLESDVPDDRIEFYCPNCGHARMAGASSLRAGDICPDCKQGYIAERER